MYRTIESSIYDDPKVMSMPSLGKFLFVYLITNRHSHVSGIYYLPIPLVSIETGIKNTLLDTLLDTLSKLGFGSYDRKTQVVFVKNMFRYQGRGEKNFRAAANHLKTLHKSKLINEFLELYPEVRRYGIDRVSDTHSQVGIQEQEQKKEQEKDTSCAEVGKADSTLEASPIPEPFISIPLNTGEEYPVTPEQVAEFKTLYPAVDVEQELRTMRGWSISNPKRRKTRDGVLRFINSWLAGKQNNPSLNGSKNGGRSNATSNLNFNGHPDEAPGSTSERRTSRGDPIYVPKQ